MSNNAFQPTTRRARRSFVDSFRSCIPAGIVHCPSCPAGCTEFLPDTRWPHKIQHVQARMARRSSSVSVLDSCFRGNNEALIHARIGVPPAVGGRSRAKRGSFANVLVPLQVLQQGLRGPPMAGGVPVPVVGEVGVLDAAALTADEATLIDDRDVPRLRQSVQSME